MLKGVAQRTDGPDGLPLAQLRAFFEVLLFLFGGNTGQQALPCLLYTSDAADEL